MYQDVSLGFFYAFKVIDKLYLDEVEGQRQVLKEVNLHRRMEHDNVVKYHKFFEDDWNVYIAFDYYKNRSLAHLLKRRGRLTEHEVRYWIVQIVEGLKYVH